MQTSRALCTVCAKTAGTFKKRKRAEEESISNDNQSSHGNKDNAPSLDGPIAADTDDRHAASTSVHPLGRYQASLRQMQAAVYPLPLNNADGKEMLPVGFVASHLTGDQSQVACNTNT